MRRHEIERLLPAAYQRAAGDGTVLAALLDVMEALHEPDQRVLANVDDLFSPYRTPDGFVAYLAGWVALDYLAGDGATALPMPVGRLRDLVAEGAMLARWRGTPHGLALALRLATGIGGFVIEEPPQRPYHIVVRVPAAAATQLPLVNRIVAAEKPAAVTSEVVPA